MAPNPTMLEPSQGYGYKPSHWESIHIFISTGGDYVKRGNEGGGWFVVDGELVKLALYRASSRALPTSGVQLAAAAQQPLLSYGVLTFISVTMFDRGKIRGPKIVWNVVDCEEEEHLRLVSETCKLNNVWRGSEVRALEMVWKEER
ncbi:hypothetical protein D9757_014223 [Collybiopsis confluens]|uniref:Uncharacterized protein n=1 Tax=Collybiopsis confluens TaxID=2823264 RepID=A0A8H5CWN4_9AGAR|nr:hypothetical protein D9757_014223 [Collybiopsis confluens]